MKGYRGSNIALFAPQQDVWDVLNIGANVVRYPVVDPNPDIPIGEADAETYKRWVRSHLDHIDSHIMPALCDCRGQIILTIHTPPGGRTSGPAPVFRMFTDRKWAKDTLKQMWVEIAHRYLGNNKVLGFDLLNEPGGTGHAIATLMRNTVKAVRTIDRTRPLIVSCPYGRPDTVGGFEVIKSVNVWYTIHMYLPLNVTHQGVQGFPAPKAYPGPNTGKARMERDLLPFRKFLALNGLHGYVGEFSISNFADEASRVAYVADLTSLMESYGWDWTYHSWREAPVWQPTAGVLAVLEDVWGRND